MLTTVVFVVATHNLAIGVSAGLVLAFTLFARRVYHLVGVKRTVADGIARYEVTGELFFASSMGGAHPGEGCGRIWLCQSELGPP